MKNLWFAVVCTLGAAACGGSSPPAQTPAAATEAPSPPETTAAVDTRQPNDVAAATSPAPVTSTVPAAYDFGPATIAKDPTAPATDDADNTKKNERDRHGALTPMDHGPGKDRDITAAIRRSVVSDKALSFNAKNVKIITVSGKVTLRGPVKSDAEKSAIEAKAKAAPGVAEVDNQIEVKK